MFSALIKVVRWTGNKKTRILFGFAYSFLISLVSAAPIAIAAWAMCDYAALASLYAGDADAAVTCLHDRKTDSCTIPYVQRLIPGTSLVVMRIASYPVGLIVREGNPKGVTSWSSLFRCGGTLANRPRGTAERVILDEKIAAFELVAQDVEGYESEAATAHTWGPLLWSRCVTRSLTPSSWPPICPTTPSPICA